MEAWSFGTLDGEVLSCDLLEGDGSRVVEDSEIVVLIGVWAGGAVLVLGLELKIRVLSDVLVLAGICETGADITSGSATTGAELPVASGNGVVSEELVEVVPLGGAL